ncbi:MAG: bifunctional phosphoribosylaminoimidazolecarboxamide formyltransferase/IMP cyclohydrolase, partial [Rhodocyclaceae bacterium]|nr:bifunctional phosphoribosylaminoimidazolecarboxamide formyltransferase/IMP cyclohydrolase [Rhodocyclaceae bacterium]
MKVSQALISVSDKHGAVDFARELAALGIQLLSTGGTAKLLKDAGIAVTDVSDYTGFPEMLDGRVKTLLPKVHGGILGIRGNAEHAATMAKHGIPTIDLVVVNLYPFQQAIAKKDCTLTDAIENIDIGGPTMVRAAAKNHGNEQGGCAVVTEPADYAGIIDELKANQGVISLATRFALAKKAFVHTARYDSAIANWLTSLDAENKPTPFPERLQLAFDKADTMRYGENPHQQAAFYREHTNDNKPLPGSIASYQQLQGKELSYNNIGDADAAWEAVKAFGTDGAATNTAACVIVKHANPCGVALGASAQEAYRRAFSTDPTSAFGGNIAFNCAIDKACAEAVSGQFAEVIIAPEITPEARQVFGAKQNLRVLIVPTVPTVPMGSSSGAFDFKRVGGGLLVQTADEARIVHADLKIVTKRLPTEQEMRDLLFAWKVAKYVKSNAIVFCGGGMTLGVGAGQMSRIDSARIASIKAA